MTNPEIQEWKAAFLVEFDNEVSIAINALARTILSGLEGRCPGIVYYESEGRIVTAFLLKAATHDEAREEAVGVFSNVVDLPSTLLALEQCDDLNDEFLRKRLAMNGKILPKTMSIPEPIEQPELAEVIQLFNTPSQE